jgi:hypothetical protein
MSPRERSVAKVAMNGAGTLDQPSWCWVSRALFVRSIDNNLLASADVTGRKVVNGSSARLLITGGGVSVTDW